MARTLDVYLNTDLAGHLTQDDDGDMSFRYAESWLKKAGAVPLSHSLPLRAERFPRKECRGFFAGILPEESKREMIARHAGAHRRRMRGGRDIPASGRADAGPALRISRTVG